MLNNNSIFSRLTSSLLLFFMVFNPAGQAFATHQALSITQPLVRTLEVKSATLDNGMSYHLINDAESQDSTTIQFSFMGGTSLERDEEEGLSALLMNAIFYGSHSYSREQIQNLLLALGLDIDPVNLVKTSYLENTITFTIPADQKELISECLAFIQDLIQYPTLGLQELELARQGLLAKSENTSESSEYSFSTEQVERFNDKWIRPNLMSLSVTGNNLDIENLEALVQSSFSLLENPAVSAPIPSELQLTLNEVRRHTEDVRYISSEKPPVIIDGKIYMDEPNWINKQKHGRWLGFILSAASVALAIPTWGASLLGVVPGMYFILSTYAADPLVFSEMRREDLSGGFKNAFDKGRAMMTLTASERRQMFIYENTAPISYSRVNTSTLAITDFSDKYNLNDMLFRNMFHDYELQTLNGLKREFILERNKCKLSREAIDAELNRLLLEYQVIRDIALNAAQKAYDNNYYVMRKILSKEELDTKVQYIQRQYQRGRMGSDDRDRLIEEAKDWYESIIKCPSFRRGLDQAYRELESARATLSSVYSRCVQTCKQTINYNNRVTQVIRESTHIYLSYNDLLMDTLKGMNPYDCSISDINDLRK
ncbi:MAG: hypothetical protein ACI8RA_002483 [Chlamydiales bacterium]|jgi:hypothetical protein